VAHLVYGIDKIWKIVNGSAYQCKGEADRFTRFIAGLPIQWGQQDKGVGCIGIFTHELGIGWRRCFKYIQVNTSFPYHAGGTVPPLGYADYLFEGMTEGPSEGCSLVGRKDYLVLTEQTEFKLGKGKPL